MIEFNKLARVFAWHEWAKDFPARAEKTIAYKSPFRLAKSEPKSAEILIYDQIGRDFWSGEGMAAKDFSQLLEGIDPNAELTVGINSPGGNVWDGLAIHNMLVGRPGHVITRNDGMAASIASVILQAGNDRQSHASAMVMIHRAWGFMIGNADDAEKFKAELEKHDQVLSELYAKRSGQTSANVLAKMSEETFFTASEAKDFGLLDDILQAQTEPARNNLAADATNRRQTAAAIQPNIQNQMSTPAAPAPAVNPPPAPTPEAPRDIDFSPVINAINALGNRLPMPGADPVARPRIENLGNPLIEKWNSLEFEEPSVRGKFVRNHYCDLRKQLLLAQNVSLDIQNANRFDYSHPGIMAANTVDAALANTVLSDQFITTMRSYIAPWMAFTKSISLSPVSKRQTIEVPLVSSAGSMQTNATNYETGDSVLAPVAVVVGERSKSWHVSRPEQNLGLQLAALLPTNVKVLAEGIHAVLTALMTNANYGADVVIGTAANFDSTDLRAILALGKDYDRVTLLLDGGHLAYLLPGDRVAFEFGEPGAYGFDGGIYKNNLWTSAATDIAGFVCGPDAIAMAFGPPLDLPSGEAISTSTIDVNGFPFSLTVWFSRASRSIWASAQTMMGAAVGDATQAEVLTTQ